MHSTKMHSTKGYWGLAAYRVSRAPSYTPDEFIGHDWRHDMTCWEDEHGGAGWLAGWLAGLYKLGF